MNVSVSMQPGKRLFLYIILVLPYFNNKFALDYRKFPSVFETAPSEKKINYTLAVLTPRKIDNGNSIKYMGDYYQPYHDNEIKCSRNYFFYIADFIFCFSNFLFCKNQEVKKAMQ